MDFAIIMKAQETQYFWGFWIGKMLLNVLYKKYFSYKLSIFHKVPSLFIFTTWVGLDIIPLSFRTLWETVDSTVSALHSSAVFWCCPEEKKERKVVLCFIAI